MAFDYLELLDLEINYKVISRLFGEEIDQAAADWLLSLGLDDFGGARRSFMKSSRKSSRIIISIFSQPNMPRRLSAPQEAKRPTPTSPSIRALSS